MNNQNQGNGYYPPNSLATPQNSPVIKQASAQPATPTNPWGKPHDIRTALRSGMVLAFCILMTLIVMLDVVSMFFSTDFAFMFIDILAILFTIGMWVIYAAAQSDDINSNIAGLKFMNGVLLARIIILWVCVAVMFIAGVIFIALGNSIALNLSEFTSLIEGFIEDSTELSGILTGDIAALITEVLGDNFSMLITGFGIFTIIASIVMMLFILLFENKIKALVGSLVNCGLNPYQHPLCAKGASIWMLVVAILYIPGILILAVAGLLTGFDPILIIGSIIMAIQCAMLVIGYVFVRRYFSLAYELPSEE